MKEPTSSLTIDHTDRKILEKHGCKPISKDNIGFK